MPGAIGVKLGTMRVRATSKAKSGGSCFSMFSCFRLFSRVIPHGPEAIRAALQTLFRPLLAVVLLMLHV